MNGRCSFLKTSGTQGVLVQMPNYRFEELFVLILPV